MKVFNQLYRRVVSESFILLFVFFCSFSILIWADIEFSNSISVPRKVLLGFCSSLFSGIFFAFLSSLFKGRIHALVRTIIIVIASMFFLFEAFLLKAFNTLFTNFIASVMLESNPKEAHELFGELLTFGTLSPLFLFLGLIVVFSYCFSRFVMPHLVRIKLFHKLFGVALVLGVGVMVYNINRFSVRRQPYFQTTPLMRSIFSLKDAYTSFQIVAERVAACKQNVPRLVKNESDVSNVVFVVGESLAKKYLHCYGYPVETTPKIDSLLKQDKIEMFTDVVTCAPSTSIAVPRMFSFYVNENSGGWYDYNLLPMVMEEAGYETFWLSNQERAGFYVNEVSALISVFSRYKYSSTRSTGIDTRTSYDEVVIPYLEKAEEGEKLFQVVHLSGSHTDYQFRYPPYREYFTSKDLPQNNYKKEEAEIVAHYLNSVLYNDSVVSEITNFYKDVDALVLYLPDHGESIFELPGKMGHGTILTNSTVEIPMFIWMSEKFKEKHPEKVNRVRGAVNKRIMTDVLAESLADLLDIHIEQRNLHYSIFSPSYDNSRRRIISSGQEF